MANLKAQLIDRSGEKSSISVPKLDSTGLDTFQANITDAANLLVHLEAISLMPVYSITFTQVIENPQPSAPVDVLYADRESGIRFIMRGNTSGKRFSMTIPAPDQANVNRLSGTDLYDLTDEPVAAFVTWLEANFTPAYGEVAGETTVEGVTVERAVHVGRNN